MFNRLISPFLLVVLLSGCATLNKDECRNADWELIGFEDASRGHALARIGQHRKACAKVDVVPDITAYEAGHERGARQYCTRERGYQEGVKGAAYQGICPPDLASAFTRAHRDGQERYQLQQRINTAASALTGYRDQIKKLEKEIADHEKAIIDSGSSSITRRERLDAIKASQQQITELEVATTKADQELLFLEQEYQVLIKQHQQWGY